MFSDGNIDPAWPLWGRISSRGQEEGTLKDTGAALGGDPRRPPGRRRARPGARRAAVGTELAGIGGPAELVPIPTPSHEPL